jgi:hypothetical protein
VVRGAGIYGLLAIAASGCGGIAVIDGGDGGRGGAGTTSATGGGGATVTSTVAVSSSNASTVTSTVSSTSSGGPECAAMLQALRDAVVAASACNACQVWPDLCQGGPLITDECGCKVVASTILDAEEQVARDAYNVWVAAGCGPLDCAEPCSDGAFFTCKAVPNARCEHARCQP